MATDGTSELPVFSSRLSIVAVIFAPLYTVYRKMITVMVHHPPNSLTF